MKVYELMKALSSMPAGAEVKVSQMLTIEDLTQNGVADIENGVASYSLQRDVVEVEPVGDSRIYLYTR